MKYILLLIDNGSLGTRILCGALQGIFKNHDVEFQLVNHDSIDDRNVLTSEERTQVCGAIILAEIVGSTQWWNENVSKNMRQALDEISQDLPTLIFTDDHFRAFSINDWINCTKINDGMSLFEGGTSKTTTSNSTREEKKLELFVELVYSESTNPDFGLNDFQLLIKYIPKAFPRLF
jgi:hypothetical protein